MDARELETHVARMGQHRMCWARLRELFQLLQRAGQEPPSKASVAATVWEPFVMCFHVSLSSNEEDGLDKEIS